MALNNKAIVIDGMKFSGVTSNVLVSETFSLYMSITPINIHATNLVHASETELTYIRSYWGPSALPHLVEKLVEMLVYC